jgi:two-component system, NtrC family, sensor histidine kinase HydH
MTRTYRFNHGSLIRHLAICTAVVVVWIERGRIRGGNSVLWIIALAALFNLLAALVSERVRIGIVVVRLSPLLGLGGWTALMLLTGGVRSPFTLGLSLEIVLAAVTASTAGIALVTAGCVLGLWAQQAALGLDGVLSATILLSGFLLAIGGLTGYLTRRWRSREAQLCRHQEEIRRRLETLEVELEEARTIGSLGRNVARLSHGLKNAVHSLRGFVGLLEPGLAGPGREREILSGLRTAIDHLEAMARNTLGPPGGVSGKMRPDGCRTPDTVKEVVRDVAHSFPAIRWSLSLEDTLPPVMASPDELREVLTIVVRNAAEAMQGRGEVVVGAAPRGEALEIQVRDRGPGIPHSDRSRLFEAGYTTKPDGHGFGLFLARRILETHGGTVKLAPAPGGGTLCSIELPLQEQAGT